MCADRHAAGLTRLGWRGCRKGGLTLRKPPSLAAGGVANNRDFRSALRELAFSCPTPFVAIAPTSNHLTVELREDLARRQSDFISMEERLGLSEDGRFVALEITDATEITPTPVEQRHAAVEKYKSDFNCTDQVIYEDAGVHKSDFYKWMKATLGNKSSKSKRIEETLRTDPKRRTRR